MAIISTTEYKAYAGITATTYDTQLAVIIPALQDTIERWTGRKFDTATFTDKLDGADYDSVTVKNPPIVSVTSVTINYVPSGSAALDASDFLFSTTDDGRLWLAASGIYRRGPDQDGMPVSPAFGPYLRFPKGRENVAVVYVGGYSSMTMPGSLKFAMYKLTAIALNQAGIDLTLKSERLGQYGYTRMSPSELSASADGALAIGVDVQQILNGFRRIGSF